jgi:GR25 family glycosyltransferase involved in LPS biosynthesis
LNKLRFINLANRLKKNEDTIQNLRSKGFFVDEYTRLEASFENDIPALGCAKSHYKCISDFISNGDESSITIIEDDWRFLVSKMQLDEIISYVENSVKNWDVIQLSATDVTSSEIDRIDTKYGELRIYKILKATSTAAYIVNQDYLTTLNTLFSKSIKRMQINKTEIRKINNAYYSKGGNKIEKNVLDKAAINYHTAIDHVWGEGQFENNFIGINLQTGFCQVYESDISGYPTDNQNRQLSKTRIQI